MRPFPLCLLRQIFPTRPARNPPDPLIVHPRTASLRVRIDPRFGEIDGEFLSILAAFEAVRQAADGMRAPLAVSLPGNFRTGAPLLVALVERRECDDQPVVVIEIRHSWENYISRKSAIHNHHW